MAKNKPNIIIFFFFAFIASLLLLSLRGNAGNPDQDELLQDKWQSNGPFELSPERGRFALLYSIAENNSVNFSLPIARFSLPDLGYENNKYVSLFSPGVSFIALPGYILGKAIGASQLGSYAIISLFAIINSFLIRKIAITLGSKHNAANATSLIFLFATPAFTYAVSLYQHHISTFLMLLSLYLLIANKGFLSYLFIWFLIALSIVVDYPNIIFFIPIISYIIFRIFKFKIKNNAFSIKIYPAYLLSTIGIIIPMLFLFWFNNMSYGDPLKMSGTVPSVGAINSEGKPEKTSNISYENVNNFINPQLKEKSVINFFKTRNLLNGFNILIFSPDRGILYYAPVVLFGIIGSINLYKRKNKYLPIILTIIGFNILLYAMWGDPWGGWAFGSRYLIPSYALMAVLISIFLSQSFKNPLVIILFIITSGYSIFVNLSGVLTTSKIPPQIEILSLEKQSNTPQKYTYSKNIDLINTNYSKSFIYNQYLKNKISLWSYYWILYSLISVPILFLVLQSSIFNTHRVIRYFRNLISKAKLFKLNILKRGYEKK